MRYITSLTLFDKREIIAPKQLVKVVVELIFTYTSTTKVILHYKQDIYHKFNEKKHPCLTRNSNLQPWGWEAGYPPTLHCGQQLVMAQ